MDAFRTFREVQLAMLLVLFCGFMLTGCGDSNDGWYVNTKSRPVANAGTDQEVTIGGTVTLDGTGSTDKEGKPLTYSWNLAEKPTGSAAVLSDSTSPSPTFVADVGGDYVIELVVNNGKQSSSADSVTVTSVNTYGYDYTPGVAYAFLAYGEAPEFTGFTGFVKIDLATGAITTIQQLFDSSSFLTGADFVKGRYLAAQYGTNKLIYVNGNGTFEEIITLAGVTSITGLSYDAAADKIYVADVTGAGTVLRAISTTDFSVTLVGTITGEIIIGLASDASGTMYGISLDADNLYRIDTASGFGTVVGPLGININFAQGIAFDRTNNILYGTLYSSSGGLYTINTTTGAATQVAPFGAELDGFAIPTQPLIPG
jgi:hypothetical protein